MALIKVPVTKRNDLPFSITYGLNTEKIVDYFKEYGETVLYYAENENQNRKPVKYVTSLSKDELHNRLDDILEAGVNTEFIRRFLHLSATHRGRNDESWNVDVTLDANRITYVWDDPQDSSKGYVEFANGGFDLMRFRTQENLDEVLTEAGSDSAIATS